MLRSAVQLIYTVLHSRAGLCPLPLPLVTSHSFQRSPGRVLRLTSRQQTGQAATALIDRQASRTSDCSLSRHPHTVHTLRSSYDRCGTRVQNGRILTRQTRFRRACVGRIALVVKAREQGAESAAGAAAAHSQISAYKLDCRPAVQSLPDHRQTDAGRAPNGGPPHG